MLRSRIFLAILVASVGMFVAACGGSESTVAGGFGSTTNPSGGVSGQSGTSIPFAGFSAPLSQSAISEKRLVTVRDPNAWSALWAEHVGTGGASRPLPEVDFSRNMVIGVFLGSLGACDKLSVEAVRQKQDPARIEVTYRHTPPPPDTMCIATLANPAALITVQKSDVPVEFVQAPARPASALLIRSGWSFGMCVDNCEAAVEIAQDGATFRSTSKTETITPVLALWGAVSEQEWQTLAASFSTLPDVIVGCPDCADEGREWIEVEQGGNKKRLDFSCKVIVNQDTRLQATVRTIRSRLAFALGLREPCDPDAIVFERLAPAVLASDIADQRFVTIRDAASWAVLWNQHAGTRAPLPVIDFSKQMVLGVFMGNQSATCGSTSIESVRQRNAPDRIEVGYRVVDPGPNVMCVAPALNQYSLVTVPASEQPVEFLKLQ